MTDNQQYIDALVESAKVLLNAQRGNFYPNKNFGSLLKTVCRQPKDEYALAYARQALDSIDGVFVKSAICLDDKFVFDLLINNQQRQVEIKR